MVTLRRFRNSDPPRLLDVWNEAFPARGAVRLRTSSPLERFAFAKPYFDPAGLFLAEDDGHCVGFAHAGFGPAAAQNEVDVSSGVICIIGVKASHQRRGIGSDLLLCCEEYLHGRGAKKLFAGGLTPLQPFYHGLYGGSDMPGFLDSDPAARPFLAKHGYQPARSVVVLQREMGTPLKVNDARFAILRQKYALREDARFHLTPWWRECVYGPSEPVSYTLTDKQTGNVAASALVWEMEGFAYRWGHPSVGILDIKVPDPLKRRGFGKFFLAQLLRVIQDQYFELVEMQVPAEAEAMLQLAKALGFHPVDGGHMYEKQ